MKARLITIVLVCLSVCYLVGGESGEGVVHSASDEGVVHNASDEGVVHNARHEDVVHSDEGVVHSVSKRTVKGGPLFGPGRGTSCTVKGSYCSCHYCKCEHGNIHCQKHGATSLMHGHGKHYCYGSMEGEHCTCDYCKCKHGFGQHGHGRACGHG